MASWFYLTLWHGNPPEMTTYLDTAISTGEELEATVIKDSAFAETINSTDRTSVRVADTDELGVEIIERNEVVWIVGKN